MKVELLVTKKGVLTFSFVSSNLLVYRKTYGFYLTLNKYKNIKTNSFVINFGIKILKIEWKSTTN